MNTIKSILNNVIYSILDIVDDKHVADADKIKEIKEYISWEREQFEKEAINEKILKAVNNLVDKSESLRSLLEADIEALEEWDEDITEFLDALDEVESFGIWESLEFGL